MRNWRESLKMKSQIFILILVLNCSSLLANIGVCQNSEDSIRTNFRVSLPLLDFGYGTKATQLSGNLPSESELILSEYSPKIGHIGMGIQFFFFDLIGVETGIEINLGSVNELNTRNSFQSKIQNYTAEILPNNYESGPLPFETGLDFASARFGLIGLISLDKFKIIPSVNYFHGIYEDYPTLEVNLTEISTGNTLVRNYLFKDININGLKTGIAFRFCRNSSNIVVPFFQLKAEFVYYKSEGIGYYTDKPFNGSEQISEDFSFTQKSYGFLLSLNAGLDFRNRVK